MRRASFRQSLLQGECYSAWGSATTAASPGAMKDLLLGDGLIPAMSALGRHKDYARAPKFPHDRQWIACETGHLDPLSRCDVYERMAEWLHHDE